MTPGVRQMFAGFARDILVPFIVTRAMLVIVSLVTLHAFQGISAGHANWEVKPKGNIGPIQGLIGPQANPLLNPWVRWDAGWYQNLAKNGYKFEPGQQSNTAFFPAYPLTIRLVHAITRGRTDRSWFIAGLIASNLALLGACAYFIRFVRLEIDEATAGRVVLYLLAFPTTLFFSSVYTESLFLLVSVAAFYHAHRGQWLAAGVFAGIAALTRSPGILLCLPLLVEYLAQRDFNLRKIKPDVLWIGLNPAALVGLMAYFYMRFGNAFATRDAQASWGGGWGALRGPLQPFLDFPGRVALMTAWVDLGFTLFTLGMVIYIVRRFRWSYGVYAALCYLFHTSWGTIESMPRYILANFPLFIALAIWGQNERFHRAFLVGSSGLAALFMIEFTLWRWVG